MTSESKNNKPKTKPKKKSCVKSFGYRPLTSMNCHVRWTWTIHSVSL